MGKNIENSKTKLRLRVMKLLPSTLFTNILENGSWSWMAIAKSSIPAKLTPEGEEFLSTRTKEDNIVWSSTYRISGPSRNEETSREIEEWPEEAMEKGWRGGEYVGTFSWHRQGGCCRDVRFLATERLPPNSVPP